MSTNPDQVILSINHYKFWKIRSRKTERPVTVTGQFDEQRWWDVTLCAPTLLGNPVEKYHRQHQPAPVPHPRLHLTAYPIYVPQPRRVVVLTNQFSQGDPATWYLGAAVLLLVPAGKGEGDEIPPLPERGDHYVGYQVLNPQRFPVEAVLVDQFDRHLGRKEEIRELEPALFCVPVQKRHGKPDARPLWFPLAHLALYNIRPNDEIPPIPVTTADQFHRDEHVDAYESVMLGVPSYKHSWDRA